MINDWWFCSSFTFKITCISYMFRFSSNFTIRQAICVCARACSLIFYNAIYRNFINLAKSKQFKSLIFNNNICIKKIKLLPLNVCIYYLVHLSLFSNGMRHMQIIHLSPPLSSTKNTYNEDIISKYSLKIINKIFIS
jgi:hypothetical protein